MIKSLLTWIISLMKDFSTRFGCCNNVRMDRNTNNEMSRHRRSRVIAFTFTNLVRSSQFAFPTTPLRDKWNKENIFQPGRVALFLQNKRTPVHYAAAARDGGHYQKILGRAGADPNATDNVSTKSTDWGIQIKKVVVVFSRLRSEKISWKY